MKYVITLTATKTLNTPEIIKVEIYDEKGIPATIKDILNTLLIKSDATWEQTVPRGMNVNNYTGVMTAIQILNTININNYDINTFFKMITYYNTKQQHNYKCDYLIYT